jgi:hypothetical protein
MAIKKSRPFVLEGGLGISGDGNLASGRPGAEFVAGRVVGDVGPLVGRQIHDKDVLVTRAVAVEDQALSVW